MAWRLGGRGNAVQAEMFKRMFNLVLGALGQGRRLRSVARDVNRLYHGTPILPTVRWVLLSLFTRLGLWRQNYQNMTESMAGCLEPGERPVCRSMALSTASYLGTRVPKGTFLPIWIPIGSLFLQKGPYF